MYYMYILKQLKEGILNGLKKKGLINGAYVTFKKISLKNVSIYSWKEFNSNPFGSCINWVGKVYAF